MKTIAKILNDYDGKFGVPRQSGLVEEVISRIIFEPEYRSPDAVRGLDAFSHLWLLWDFHQMGRTAWRPTVRPPRLGGNERIGVFATRSPFRPNPIGLSCVRLLGVELTREGPVLRVAGADLVSGTPIYDIKPYLPYADCHPEATGGFTDAAPRRHLRVILPPDADTLLTSEQRKGLAALLAEDPRPAYQSDPNRIYSFEFAGRHVSFRVEEDTVLVTSLRP